MKTLHGPKLTRVRSRALERGFVIWCGSNLINMSDSLVTLEFLIGREVGEAVKEELSSCPGCKLNNSILICFYTLEMRFLDVGYIQGALR